MGAESCCPAVQIEQQLTPRSVVSSFHQNSDLQTLQHLGQMQLLASISFQAKQVSSSQQHLSNITSNFYNLDQFIELVDNNFCNHSPFLHLLQSKVNQIYNPRYDFLENQCLLNQICIIFHHSMPSTNLSESQLQRNMFQGLKIKLRIVQLLRITQSQLSKQGQFIKAICSTLRSIPGSDSYFWDVTPRANFAEMTKHLHYKTHTYLQFLNSYISLNDPLSLLNVKYILQFSLRFMCLPYEEKEKPIYCKIKLDNLEKQLILKGNFIMTVNFLKFSKNNVKKVKKSIGQVLLILSQSSPKHKNKIRHMTNLYILPFTLFKIVEVINEGQQAKIYLRELQDQIFLNHLAKPLADLPIQQKSEYVAITQQNLGTQLQSLKKKYQESLQNYLQQAQQNSPDFTHLQQLIRRQYQNYQKCHQAKQNTVMPGEQKEKTVTTKQQRILVDKQRDQLFKSNFKVQTEGIPEKIQNCNQINRQEAAEVQSQCQMKQLTSNQIKKYEKVLSEYIKQLKFDKLQNQLQKVDRFYYLTSLNLSHCHLERIQHMGCFLNLKQLFLYSNEITKIQGLQNNLSLRLLSFSRNKIAKLQNIKHLSHLRELYVTKNKLGKESAEHLALKQFRKLHSLAVSFVSDQEYCFQLICKEALFKLLKLVINQSQLITQRTKNKLRKKFNYANIQFFI